MVGLAAVAAILATALPVTAPAHAEDVPPSQRRYIVEIDRIRSVQQTGPSYTNPDYIYARVFMKQCGPFYPGPCPLANNTMYIDLLEFLHQSRTGYFDHYNRTITPKSAVENSDPGDQVLDGRGGDGDRWVVNREVGVRAPIAFTVSLYDRFPANSLIGTREINWSPELLAAPTTQLSHPGASRLFSYQFNGLGGEFSVTFLIVRVS